MKAHRLPLGLGVISLFLPSVLSNPTVTFSSPVIDLGYAKYQGSVVHDKITGVNNTHFIGIRFAAPPTGTARFNSPSPPASTPGIQGAISFPPMCLQAPVLGSSPDSPFSLSPSKASDKSNNFLKRDTNDTSPPESEDCLFLSVVTPGQIGEKKDLPVVVWIYGGGYADGSSSAMGFIEKFYDGSDLVRESGGNAVVVLIQYRLGLFGFLSGESVERGGALNAGLLDQQFALRWVQDHISKFGGDPGKVTIWGQSAGAGSVLQHLVANDGKTQPPLFRAAITSSTFLPQQFRFNDRIPEIIYNDVVSRVNCSSVIDTLGCLRQVDVNDLQAVNQAITSEGFSGSIVTFVPVIDRKLITDRPKSLLKKGKVNTKNVYTVTNRFEGTIWVNQSTTDTVEEYISKMFPTLTPQNVQTAAAQYVGLGDKLTQLSAIVGESIFICPTYSVLNALPRTSFKGEFAVPPAFHGNDLLYYFNGGQFPDGTSSAFGVTFSQTFMNFVQFLDPTRQAFPTNVSLNGWKQWNGKNEVVFNQTETGQVDITPAETDKTLLERCSFWESVADVLFQ